MKRDQVDEIRLQVVQAKAAGGLLPTVAIHHLVAALDKLLDFIEEEE